MCVIQNHVITILAAASGGNMPLQAPPWAAAVPLGAAAFGGAAGG